MSVELGFDRLSDGGTLARIALRAPRANALTRELLRDQHAALDAAEAGGAVAVLLTGGRNFSSGGDVKGFHEAAGRGEAREYATALVPELQALVLRLVSLPCLVAVAARGAVTGGSAGLLFAADMAAVHPECFVQPYYAQVGFAPDGGWTALLPELVGAGRAESWVLQDRRARGAELVEMGLADSCDAEPEDAALRLLDQRMTGPRLAAKALIWDEARRDLLKARLDRETAAFLDRIARPETHAGMDRFLAGLKETADV